MKSLEQRIAAIEQRLNIQRKPINEWMPGVKYETFGVDPSAEVDIETLLDIQNNRIDYQYHLMNPEYDWLSELTPVPVDQNLEAIQQNTTPGQIQTGNTIAN